MQQCCGTIKLQQVERCR